MAMWLHISAKNKTNVLQEGLHADSQEGAGFTKHGWQSEPHSPNTNIMCKRWDTLDHIPRVMVKMESLSMHHAQGPDLQVGAGFLTDFPQDPREHCFRRLEAATDDLPLV